MGKHIKMRQGVEGYNFMWKSNGNYGEDLIIGEFIARVSYNRTRQGMTIEASIRTPLFPPMQKTFTSMAEARAWCEHWLAFATELLQLRKTVEGLREQRLKDFQEIMNLREELHNYKYPKMKIDRSEDK